MQTIGPGIAEVKRMFVRPPYRGQGIGGALLRVLIADLVAAGYTTLRLDSARFMREAHRLYQAAGFREREPYPESELPADLYHISIFMERALND
jgi:GNAT superfamily N-acetyltransferase